MSTPRRDFRLACFLYQRYSLVCQSFFRGLRERFSARLKLRNISARSKLRILEVWDLLQGQAVQEGRQLLEVHSGGADLPLGLLPAHHDLPRAEHLPGALFQLHLVPDLGVPVGLGAAVQAVGEPEHRAVSEAMQDARLECVAVRTLRPHKNLLFQHGTKLESRGATDAHENVDAIDRHKR